jgi:hypothetical protein
VALGGRLNVVTCCSAVATQCCSQALNGGQGTIAEPPACTSAFIRDMSSHICGQVPCKWCCIALAFMQPSVFGPDGLAAQQCRAESAQ